MSDSAQSETRSLLAEHEEVLASQKMSSFSTATTVKCDNSPDIHDIASPFPHCAESVGGRDDDSLDNEMSNQTYTRAELRKLEDLKRLVVQLQAEDSLERVKTSEACDSFVAFILERQASDPLLIKKKQSSLSSCLNCSIG
eukprot:maker-scaffold82_size396747-snap-gene-2.34 protein:Tk06835 transcript:maker-scaffold82_size396747-snap-gene-2.34-mRNA-1 annotation:"guanine nucleotide-binding protein g subunit gamma-t1"